MAITDQQRLSLHMRLVEFMGQEDAEILMEHLPKSPWDQMATKDDVKASELRILTELVKTNAALVETNAALVKTNAELAETRVGFQEALAATRLDFREALAETRTGFQEALAETNASLADTDASVVGLRGEMQLGFARLERRLAWYLVAVAALLVGFGLAVWIPLVGALSEAGSEPPAGPVPAEAQPLVQSPG